MIQDENLGLDLRTEIVNDLGLDLGTREGVSLKIAERRDPYLERKIRGKMVTSKSNYNLNQRTKKGVLLKIAERRDRYLDRKIR